MILKGMKDSLEQKKETDSLGYQNDYAQGFFDLLTERYIEPTD